MSQAAPSTESKRKKTKPQNDDDLDRLDAIYSWYTWSDCKLAQRYDKERDFYPQPGPSNLNYYENDDIVGYYRPVSGGKEKVSPRSTGASSKNLTVEKKTPPRNVRGRKRNGTQALSPIHNAMRASDSSDWEDDIQVQSIYEQSYADLNTSMTNATDSPLPNLHSQCNGTTTTKTPSNATSFLDKTISTPLLAKFMENVKSATANEMNEHLMANHEIRIIGQCKITPLELAPNHDDVLNEFDAHKMPKTTHPIPFYSNPSDLLADNSKKEIGHTVLQLHGNAIDDCEEFQSALNIQGLLEWQRDIALPNGIRITRGKSNKSNENAGKIRRVFAREKKTEIVAAEAPPTHLQAIEWLNERKTKKRPLAANGDVAKPAKVQRRNSNGIKMNGDDPNSNGVNDSNDSQRDIVGELLAKKELTITRVTRSNKAKSSTIPLATDAHPLQILMNNSNYHDDAGDHSNDSVICLSGNLSTKQSIPNSFCQVRRPRRIHLSEII